MKVYFIGAGPGAPDLITVRGLELIKRCPVVLYAGSLVPVELVAAAPDHARVIDTAALTLDEIIAEMEQAHRAHHDVARVHSGDPSIYGAVGEQMRRLDDLDIDYEVVPGVPAFAAAAAALKRELTLPGVSQSIILSRTSSKSSPMPKGEDLKTLSKSGATLILHLSIANLPQIVKELIPHYGEDCPVVVAYRVSWPDQTLVPGTLGDIIEQVKTHEISRTALILVGKVLGDEDFMDSRLYSADHSHVLRSPHDC
jgi:precorrin-4/cobalt-precorrin-4 C11-methyltransferase